MTTDHNAISYSNILFPHNEPSSDVSNHVILKNDRTTIDAKATLANYIVFLKSAVDDLQNIHDTIFDHNNNIELECNYNCISLGGNFSVLNELHEKNLVSKPIQYDQYGEAIPDAKDNAVNIDDVVEENSDSDTDTDTDTDSDYDPNEHEYDLHFDLYSKVKKSKIKANIINENENEIPSEFLVDYAPMINPMFGKSYLPLRPPAWEQYEPKLPDLPPTWEQYELALPDLPPAWEPIYIRPSSYPPLWQLADCISKHSSDFDQYLDSVNDEELDPILEPVASLNSIDEVRDLDEDPDEDYGFRDYTSQEIKKNDDSDFGHEVIEDVD